MPHPNAEERTCAAVCHIVSIFFPYAGPAFFYFVRGKSKFVALHAAQAFFEALVLSIVLLFAGAISLFFSLRKVWELVETRGASFSWDLVWTTLLKAGATWVILALIGGYYLIASIFDALGALRGNWSPSLISGRLAKRLVLKNS